MKVMGHLRDKWDIVEPVGTKSGPSGAQVEAQEAQVAQETTPQLAARSGDPVSGQNDLGMIQSPHKCLKCPTDNRASHRVGWHQVGTKGAPSQRHARLPVGSQRAQGPSVAGPESAINRTNRTNRTRPGEGRLGKMSTSGLIDALKPYPAYKDSGLPWFGRMPDRWTVLRAKCLFREVDQRSATGEETHLSMSQQHGLVQSARIESWRRQSESHVGGKLCQTGDLVLNRLKAHLGVFAHASVGGIVSPDYTVLRLRRSDDNVRYFEAAFRTPACVTEIRKVTKGIVEGFWRLYTDDFYNLRVPSPPPAEQMCIARFLDHLDRRVRRYIRTKRQLIALLNEQKQAIIHRAVTRGLDPNVRLKPSGVEWLGEVPEHWNIWQIGRLASVGNGSTPSRGNLGYWSGGTYPWLNSSSVNRSCITEADQFVTDLSLRECHLPKVPPGSVLVAITGQGKTRGTAALLCMEATINQHIAYITPRKHEVSARFLQFALRGAYSQLRAMSDDSGSTKGALTCSDLKHFKVAVPPLDEQERLLSAVSLDMGALDRAINQTQHESDLVHEYYTRLAVDVISGKPDVREAAACLPAEEDKPEPVDETDGIMDGDEVDADAVSEEIDV